MKKEINCLWFIIIIILCIGIILGTFLKKKRIVTDIKEYVHNEYGFSAIDVRIYHSIDGLNYATVKTEDCSFEFDVFIGKNNRITGDLYREKLTEYRLENAIQEMTKPLIDKENIMVVLETRFGNNQITVEEINSDELFLNSDISYFCSINNVILGSEESLIIFKKITKNFNPTSIYFCYINEKGSKVVKCINRINFNKIQSVGDFITVIK